MANTDYRKKYELETGSIIVKGFQIHHLDGDRSNNHIKNLVSIPISLHSRYHNINTKFNECVSEIKSSIYFRSSDINRYNIIISEYIDIKEEIYNFIEVRNLELQKHGNR